MRTDLWLKFFKEHSDVKIFHFKQLKLLTGMNEQTLRVALSRLSQKNIIKRISRGFYSNPFNLPILKEISARIYQPSYISLESSLSESGILSQIPQVLTCVTVRLPRTFKTSFGTIIYHQIKKKLFWGFENRNAYLMAEKEKALLDWLYLNKKHYGSCPPLDELDLAGINRKKLIEYSLRFPEFIQKSAENL